MSDDTESDYVSETSNEYDENGEVVRHKVKEEQVIEVDYIVGESFKLQEDGYFVTFAAYMTNDVSPRIVNYATNLTIKLFALQCSAISGFLWDYKNFDQF